ncbi:MAG: family 10 glycosylhydrolase [Bacteroidales bacterium]|nr:family 10 glycosylhydrolase [Bacteroidales bacterium]
MNSYSQDSQIPVSTQLPANWAWMYPHREYSDHAWRKEFRKIHKAGIQGILMLWRGTDLSDYERIMRMGQSEGLRMEVWIPVTNPHGKQNLAQEHPEWFMINRNGESCLDHPPYISSYKWLCPNQPGVKEYLVDTLTKLARQDWVDGVHLDYIRYPDVILPQGIQPKYNLVQDHEFPEYDFCYCDQCRKKFKKLTGTDPGELKDPAHNEAWVQFRYQTITTLVNEIANAVHREGKTVTAAVFPTPELAKKLVRQDWVHWDIDAVMPMMYHKYYNQPLEWIEQATREGVTKLDGHTPLFSGLFVTWIQRGDFTKAIRYALDGGASGVCLFIANRMTRRQWRELKKVTKK